MKRFSLLAALCVSVTLLITAIVPAAAVSNLLTSLNAREKRLIRAIVPAATVSTLPTITKWPRRFDDGKLTAETTLTHLPDGRLVAVTFGGHEIFIRDPSTAAVIKSIPTPGGMFMGTAISSGGLLHVFGTTPICDYLKPGGRIVHATIDANWTLSAPTTIYTDSSMCNLGLTTTPHGWVMSVETQHVKPESYSTGIFFLTAPDINGTTWTRTGVMASTGNYIGSPKIHYSSARDEFFVTYSAQADKMYYTAAARMPSDLSTFIPFAGNAKWPARTAILAPDVSAEMVDNSDVTYVEDSGHVEGIYVDGNQDTTAHLRRFTYPGSTEQFEQEFFPTKLRNAQLPARNGG